MVKYCNNHKGSRKKIQKAKNVLCLIRVYYQRFEIILAKKHFGVYNCVRDRENTHASSYTLGKTKE